MPVVTVHLIALTEDTILTDFISKVLQSASTKPLVLSKVLHWLIPPTKIDADALLKSRRPWDLLLINLGTDPLPETLRSNIECHWTCSAGVPSRLTTDFASKNHRILHPDHNHTPGLEGSRANAQTSSTSVKPGISPDLHDWIAAFSTTGSGKSPVSMLNFLSIKPGMAPSYLQYGAEFAKSSGSRRGGNPKLMGPILSQKGPEHSVPHWEEFALVSYPSILHFAEMLASEDYQAINLKYRVPAVEDTFILCTSEIDVEILIKGLENRPPPFDNKVGAKL